MVTLLDRLRQDLALARRSLRRSPSYALIVTLTLAIGIGANAAVISIIDTAFFRKLPVPDPERLVVISSWITRGGPGSGISHSSFPDYLDLRTRVRGVDDLAAYAMSNVRLGDEFGGVQVWSAFVTANYFSVLDVRAQRGRFLAPDEDRPAGAHPVVVISDAMWHSRFGGDEHVIGRELSIGNGRFTIIGIAPPHFTGVHADGRTDLWLPYTMQAEATGSEYTYQYRDARLALIVGRLAPRATLPRVQASLDAAARDLRATYPQTDGSLVLGVQVHDRLAPVQQAPAALASMLLVLAMVALLHLVACSNVASLMLARAAVRRRALGIRLCLGASPGRVLTHALAEPALLAVFGAAAGVVVARWLTLRITSMEFMSALDPGLDARVLAIVMLTAVATILLVGLLPARDAARRDPLTSLRSGAGGRVADRYQSTTLLVVGQVVVSLVLLANAGTFLRTFERQLLGDPGFDRSRLAVVSITFRDDPKGLVRDWDQLDELTARVTGLPGVQRAAVAIGAPLLRWQSQEVVVAGYQYAAGTSRRLLVQDVGPGYFATIGARMVAGREFEPTDRTVGTTTRPGWFDVAIVNETMARRYWPGADPIGKQVAYRGEGAATVVGVVQDIHDVLLSRVVPRAYFPYYELMMRGQFQLVVRTRSDPAALRAQLYAVVAGSSLRIKPPIIRTMDDVVGDALALPRIGGIAVSLIAAVALLLTAIGLYGLVATWGAQRTREIGIRIALGARAWQVHRLLLGRVGQLIGIGALIGLPGAVAMIRIERTWWGSSIVLEKLPLALALMVLAPVAGLAAYLPSRRAVAVDPAEVLRSD